MLIDPVHLINTPNEWDEVRIIRYPYKWIPKTANPFIWWISVELLYANQVKSFIAPAVPSFYGQKNMTADDILAIVINSTAVTEVTLQ